MKLREYPVTLANPGDVNRFEVGDPVCLPTMRPVAECAHCASLREMAAKYQTTFRHLHVVHIDREHGVLTLTQDDESHARVPLVSR